jgi:hypothetical protein
MLTGGRIVLEETPPENGDALGILGGGMTLKNEASGSRVVCMCLVP